MDKDKHFYRIKKLKEHEIIMLQLILGKRWKPGVTIQTERSVLAVWTTTSNSLYEGHENQQSVKLLH